RRGHRHGEAGAGLSGHYPAGEGSVWSSCGGIQCERRICHGQGGGGQGLDRRAPDCYGSFDLHSPRRPRHDSHVFCTRCSSVALLAPAAESAMLLGQKLGDFEIEGELGAGAMGMVYRARYVKNNATVAIKIISGGHDTNPNSVARFERETAILKKLSHPNIVRLYASGRWRNTPFYVMEYVAGETLEARL